MAISTRIVASIALEMFHVKPPAEYWLTRRRFFQALAASVVAAGLPLPVGFPTAPMRSVGHPMLFWDEQRVWSKGGIGEIWWARSSDD